MNDLNQKYHPHVWPALGIALLAVLAYVNSFPGAFILDDNTIILENPLVASIDLGRIFTTDYWGLDLNSGLYRPLTILSFAVNRLLFGLSPLSIHAVNVGLHALVSILLFQVLLRFGLPRALSGMAAMLFAVHPVHTEVINQGVGRAELLAALFVFSGLICSTIRHRVWSLVGTVLCFGAALLTKENGVVLLGLLPLLDLASGRLWEREWRSRLPLYLALLGTMLAWLAWRTWGIEHRVPPDLIEQPFAPLYYMEPMTRVLTALKIQWYYLWKLVWPADLQAVYAGQRWFAPVELFSVTGFVVLLATGALIYGVVTGCRRGSWIGWGLALYAIAFVPTSNLVIPIGVGMAERLAYLPSVGFCLAAAAGIALLPRRRLAWTVSGAIVVALLIATLDRNSDYDDAVTLWSEAAERDPQNPIAWIYLGESYFDAGETGKADETFRHHEQLIRDFNRKTSGYTEYLYQRGNFESAIRVGLRLEEDGESTPVNRMALARSYFALGQYPDAMKWLESCREHYGEYALYWRVRGEILAGLGRYDEAVDAWNRAMTLATYDDLPLRMAELLIRMGRFTEAEQVARELVDRAPGADAWNVLGITLAVQERYPEAIAAFERALAFSPNDTQLLDNIEQARREAGH